jgi:ADP-ribosylglycohydrolase
MNQSVFPTRPDRIAGCMYGAAIGDAIGAAFEFVPSDTIQRHLGSPYAREYTRAMPGSLLHPREAAMPTDDTAMALCVADVVLGGDAPTPAAFAQAFLRDLDRTRGRYGRMFWTGGPGGATTRALTRLGRGTDPATCGHPDDGGNGAAMRAHPVGFLRDRDAVLAVAAVQARVTHGHPTAIAAAQAVAVIVHDALSGAEASTQAPRDIDDGTFLDAWRAAHAGDEPEPGRALPRHLRDAGMSGWETVAAAHAIAIRFAHAPFDAIAAAAASGGDTDTVASIVGAIVGARYGMAIFPTSLIDGLSARTAVDAVLALAAARAT